MIRFAVWGDHPVSNALALAAATDPRTRLVCWVGPSHQLPASLQGLPHLGTLNSADELISHREVDAVIVAGRDEATQSTVRQLLQAGKQVLVLPQLVQSVSFFYELALLDAESPGQLFPLMAHRGWAFVDELRQLIAEQGLGRIRHVRFERGIAPGDRATPGTAGLIPHDEFVSQLLLDADLLRSLLGVYDQVSAIRSGDAVGGYSQATVTLSGSSVPQVVWSASSAPQPTWKMTLVGEQGGVVLEPVPQGDRSGDEPLQMTVTRGDQRADASQRTGAVGKWLLEEFLRNGPPPPSPGSGSPSAPAPQPGTRLWNELACAVELIDAAERSVRRRRTIDVHFETPSERGLFKTQMTAAGCSLLMVTFVAVVMYLVLEASFELPQFLRKLLVVLIFVPLGIFLLLQLLYFVTRPAAPGPRSPDADS
jgi:predicted dehydrogenase